MNFKDINYYFRDVYLTGNYLKLDKSNIKAKITSSFSSINTLPLEFIEKSEENFDIEINFKFDNFINEDGYTLIINEKSIDIYASNTRGIIYGSTALSKLIIRDDDNLKLMLGKVSDSPSFEIRGIIEGFYGIPWSFEDRIDMIDFMKKNRMNCYMYAPKDDLYHRDLWREEYPNLDYEKIKNIKKKCDNNYVDFYYCLSPGKDIKYSSTKDLELIENKLEAMIKLGIRSFALLMDDIDYTLNEEDALLFKTPAIAQSYICNKIYEFLRVRIHDFKLIMCPTEYWENWDSEYRRDLRLNLNSNILVFWTGYRCFTPTLDEIDSKNAHEYFGHEMVLWDNFPVNDADKDRVFMGPIRSRYSKLNERAHIGMVANPMNQSELSKIALSTSADYMWNSEKYNPDFSWEKAIVDFAGDKNEAFKFFCENNEVSRLFFYEDLELNKAIEKLDIKWLDDYFQKWENSILDIRYIKNEKLQIEINPWLERATMDLELWGAIKSFKEQSIGIEEVKLLYDKCNNFSYKIGNNVAVRIAEKEFKDILK